MRNDRNCEHSRGVYVIYLNLCDFGTNLNSSFNKLLYEHERLIGKNHYVSPFLSHIVLLTTKSFDREQVLLTTTCSLKS